MSTDDLERLTADSGAPGDPGLARALGELRGVTHAETSSIDVTAAVLARTDAPSVRARWSRHDSEVAKDENDRRPRSGARGVLIRARRWAPIAAAATLALFVGRETLWAKSVQVSAPSGARLWSDGAWQAFSGERGLRAPFRIASPSGPVDLEAQAWRATLTANSELGVDGDDRPELARGELVISLDEERRLAVARHEVRAFGRLRLGAVEENEMSRSKKISGIATGIVAVIAVYAGYAHLGTGAQARLLEAPSAAVVDAQGEVRRIPLAEAEEALGRAGGEQRTGGSLGEVAAAAPLDRTGGYWDEAQRTVRFALAGEVFDAQSGRPISNFELELVALSVKSFDAATRLSRSVEGRADGHFQIDRLGLGEWRLTVRADGYAPSSQRIHLNAVTDDPYVVVPLSQGGRLSGVVSDFRGQPIEGAHVTLVGCGGERCPKVDTDGKGAFVLAGAPDDAPFALHAQHPRHGVATLPNLRITPGQTEHVQLQLSGILRVFGGVWRGTEQLPAVGVTVRAGDVSTVTDATGGYVILVPLREDSVRVVTSSALPVEFASYPESRSAEPIRWVQADTHVAELEKNFFLAMETARLVGRITDEHGKPVANAKLYVANTMGWTRREHETFPEETVTGDDGNYRIDDIPAGAGYVLSIHHAGRNQQLGAVMVNEPKQVVANFTIGGSALRGRFVERGSRQPFELSRHACSGFGAMSTVDSAVYPARCLSDGGFEFRALPPGSYRLGNMSTKVHRAVTIEEVKVEVPREGVPSEVEVVVSGPRSATWTLRVTDVAGKFVGGLMLRYYVGRGSVTSSLDISDEGTATLELPTDRTDIFIDAPGYAPAALDLKDKDPKGVIDVRLTRESAPPPPSE